jgi:anti-sigma factor RsiW
MSNRPISEEDLHAYVDGEIAGGRCAEVEAWLATHPDDAARVAAWRAQAEAIRARYGGVADEPMPARLALAQLARGRRWPRIAAAAVVLLGFAAGAAAGWLGHGIWEARPARAVTTEAIDAHRLYIAEQRHPIEVRAGESHLVTWLSRRVGTSLPAPDLEPQGLRLLGGRLLPGTSGHAAALYMYEAAGGERFTIYSRRAKAGGAPLRYQDAGKVGAFFWMADETAYVVSGPADRERLQKVAEAAHDQFERRATRTGALKD